MGLNLFVHSVQLVLADWRNALRISGVLYLACAIGSLIIAFLFPVPTQPEQIMAAGAGLFIPNLILALLYGVAIMWLAVAWHRYVLLDEMPTGLVPEFNSSRILAYFGNSMLIGVILFAIGIVMVIITGIIATILGPFAGIVGIVFYFFMLIASYRVSPILPAAALGKPLKIGEAWAATSGASGAIVVLALISILAVIVINIPVFVLAFLGPVGSFLGLLWSLGTGWITTVVGVSILTTIYGHYVEGREISSAAMA